MDKKRKGTSNRKPPEPTDSHGVIDDWMKRLMPDLGVASAAGRSSASSVATSLALSGLTGTAA